MMFSELPYGNYLVGKPKMRNNNEKVILRRKIQKQTLSNNSGFQWILNILFTIIITDYMTPNTVTMDLNKVIFYSEDRRPTRKNGDF